jgi:hypothetical protein
VRNSLLKVISLSAYKQLLLEKNQSDNNADAALSSPEHAIDSSMIV